MLDPDQGQLDTAAQQRQELDLHRRPAEVGGPTLAHPGGIANLQAADGGAWLKAEDMGAEAAPNVHRAPRAR